MAKKECINSGLPLNKQNICAAAGKVLGGFGSAYAGLSGMPSIDSDEHVEFARGAMAIIDGNYPLSMSECEIIGISGGCGPSCHALATGRCPCEGEMLNTGE